MNLKVTETTTLKELKEMLDDARLGIEFVRYRRLNPGRNWSVKVVTALDEHPELEGEATGPTPWDAITVALRQITRARRGDPIT